MLIHEYMLLASFVSFGSFARTQTRDSCTYSYLEHTTCRFRQYDLDLRNITKHWPDEECQVFSFMLISDIPYKLIFNYRIAVQMLIN